jgi:hypothetical protein
MVLGSVAAGTSVSQGTIGWQQGAKFKDETSGNRL